MSDLDWMVDLAAYARTMQRLHAKRKRAKYVDPLAQICVHCGTSFRLVLHVVAGKGSKQVGYCPQCRQYYEREAKE